MMGHGTQLTERYHKYLTKTSTNSGNLADYISQAEAARIRGVSKQAIADLISRGRLTTVKVADRILVLRSEVETFVVQPKRGRPRKKVSIKETSKETLPKK
jgi:excisionase family DNA binding protein